jgi:hypothetical protein
MRCPFCQFENEEGALFCEQCKSDLAADPMRSTVPYAAPGEREPFGRLEGFGDIPSAEPLAGVAAPEAVPTAPPVFEAPIGEIEETPAPVISSDTMRPMEIPEPSGTPAAAPTASSVSAPTVSGPIPAGVTPNLAVLRGLKIGAEYPIYEGLNFIGRADEKPVDIDLEDQEPPERIWSSRQHACIAFEGGVLTIEDLNSSNGTFVNRTRVYPGQKRQLNVNDVIQIGTVQLKVKI